ncbi:MAG: DNA-protecting protein DprA [Chloroflexi bacterium]|jgi:DNA processing protein|nr:DNA-protecting protein DprA [Chloroflexota bacterium]
MNDLKYWVAFHQISGIGPVTFAKLEARFGDLETAWRSSLSDLVAAGVPRKVAGETERFRDENEPDEIFGEIDLLGITPLHLRHPDYPSQLAETPAAPSVIYVKGQMLAADEPAIAIVGSRDATPYGLEMTRRLSYDLARAGVTVVSGLARGIDTAAHRAALEAGGRTMAILGSGLDRIYPQRNIPMAEKIVENGALFTEYPPGVSALPQHFPRRNRVISGLCHGVLVVEAAFKSGAMLTVNWALEQDRDVFAVPGSALSEKSKGTNWLIQQGAKLTTTADDILEELNIERTSVQSHVDQPETATSSNKSGESGKNALDNLARENNVLSIERRVVDILEKSSEPIHVDDITRALGEAPAAVSSVLVMLELQGTARQVGSMQFIADRERPVVSP